MTRMNKPRFINMGVFPSKSDKSPLKPDRGHPHINKPGLLIRGQHWRVNGKPLRFNTNKREADSGALTWQLPFAEINMFSLSVLKGIYHYVTYFSRGLNQMEDNEDASTPWPNSSWHLAGCGACGHTALARGEVPVRFLWFSDLGLPFASEYVFCLARFKRDLYPTNIYIYPGQQRNGRV